VRRRATYGPRNRGAGFTLIEILAVLAVIALIMGSAVRGFKSLAKSDLRTSAARMSGAIHYLFDRASTTGKHHRLVLDLNEGRYWPEVSDDKFYAPHEAESQQQVRQREDKEADEDEEQRRKQEQANGASGGGGGVSGALGALGLLTGGGSSYDPSKLEVGEFRPKRPRFASFKETALKPMTLKNAKIRSVYTPRLTEPVTSGRAYIYFFPLGQTEDAIITLSDPSGSTIYSLVVHPITGRVQVYSEEIRPPQGARFDDEGNRVVE
jgi:general secretion pathway protein H